ncbi:hypothetical protein RJ639_021388 [Escallonia herrerae]|uniref:F-box domain-containing protein n=1 Tax=Escallonia herrerae TaxID=1293975 RepID=A0AA88V2D5_9ASTE|nr:hypothetical protein RJ639_021388 [Escallonia herrerae]
MDLHSRPPSKPKRICPNEDRISKLPDAILTHLLSFLPENYAVRTGLLSTRWKYIWALLPTLLFKMPRRDCHCRCRCEETLFLDFIDKILILRSGLPIQKFHLSSSHRCDVIAFTRLCVTSQCATSKRLISILISPCLKTLHLHSLIYTDDASIKMLFSSCPVLEELHLYRFLQTEVDNVETINVLVPSLKRLSLRFKLESHSHTCTGGYNVISCFPGIFQAEITVDKDDSHGVSDAIYGEGLVQMIRSIAAVKDLFLSLRGNGFACHYIPTFPNLLRLHLGLADGGWELLPILLESMPNVEVLVFVDGLVPFDFIPGTLEVGYLHAHREEDQLKLIRFRFAGFRYRHILKLLRANLKQRVQLASGIQAFEPEVELQSFFGAQLLPSSLSEDTSGAAMQSVVTYSVILLLLFLPMPLS